MAPFAWLVILVALALHIAGTIISIAVTSDFVGKHMGPIKTTADESQYLAGILVNGVFKLTLTPWSDLYFATVIVGSYEDVRMPFATKFQAVCLPAAAALFVYWLIIR